MFCGEDADNRDNENHERHLALHVLDFESTNLVEHLFLDANDAKNPEEEPLTTEPSGESRNAKDYCCPVCKGPMKDMIGRNAGKGLNCAKSNWDSKSRTMIQPCGSKSTIWFD